VPATLPSLEPSLVPTGSPLHRSQRFLSATFDSVEKLVEETYPALRATRPGSGGRSTHAESDVFRAAVVFAGAGVDTVLKEAIRACVSLQIDATSGVSDKFKDWVTRYIQNGQELNARRLAELLTTNSGDALRVAYVEALTGNSLQSQSQLQTALAALGFDGTSDRALFTEAATLNPLFKVRNMIAHEMDMTPAGVSGSGSRTRHDRPIAEYVIMCHTGLNCCQKVLNRLQTALP
jgi:hypothetical protein